MKMFRLAIALLAGLALAAPILADEEKVPLDKLPAKVTAAVKEKFKDGELVSALKEVADGKTLFEVQLKHKGHAVDVTVTEDGTITVIEKEITAKDLPKAVAAAVEEKFPKATWKKVEEITKGEKITFEVLLTTADKKEFEVVLDPSGKIIETEEKKEEKKDK